jgi:hypothetical protein
MIMRKSPAKSLLKLSATAETALIAAARDGAPVQGLTHDFYKYPARFSPIFARAAIQTFTEPGDLVLDNHVGGGTTIVEALAAGRNAVGIDISTLAEFVARVKTTILSDADLRALRRWASRLREVIGVRKTSVFLSDYSDLGYYKHLNNPSRWRLRKAIEQALASAMRFDDPNLEAFGRCVVLRTAQWALDGRASLPSLDQFRDFLEVTAMAMIDGAHALRIAVDANGTNRPCVSIINRSAAGLEDEQSLQRQAPKLVVTSPPYPGVHVLYHRFQVDGRKESPLPFMIAGKLDGAGGSYYTMGDRHYPELATYFSNIKASMSSVAAVADEKTIVAQMLAFSDASWQLPSYLQAMEEAGLNELFLTTLQTEHDGRLWRDVPGRRWYSTQRGSTPGSQEVVLFHRKACRSAVASTAFSIGNAARLHSAAG